MEKIEKRNRYKKKKKFRYHDKKKDVKSPKLLENSNRFKFFMGELRIKLA